MVDGLLRDILTTSGDGVRGDDLHGNVVREGLELIVLSSGGVVEGELDDVGVLAVVVHVAGNGAVLNGDAAEADDLLVLADDEDALLEGLVNGGVVHRAGHEGVDVGGIVLGDNLGEVKHEALELGVGGDEVGLAGNLHQGANLAVLGNVGGDGALVGVAAGLLDSLGEAVDAQDVDSLLDVALSLDECLLALHHGGVGDLTELLDQGSGNLSHVNSSS